MLIDKIITYSSDLFFTFYLYVCKKIRFLKFILFKIAVKITILESV